MTVCGTGNWTGPLPGDPDNNVLLSAVSGYGGVRVSWTFPATFPYAVAHIALYRSTALNFGGAALIATVNSSFYFDENLTETTTQYYYWIVIVSINGTYGSPIGPAGAVSQPTIESVIELLTGKIERGVLSVALKSELDNISLLGSDITTEVAARIAANRALSDTVAGLDGEVAAAITIIETQTLQRITDNEAMAAQLTLVAAGLETSIAGVAEEFEAFVSPVGAYGSWQITTEATLNGDVATGQIGLVTHVTNINGELEDIGALYTVKLNVNGLIGGFGMLNDGLTVNAGFDVDQFWVGRSALDPITGLVTQVKPFIIDGSDVFINQAIINKLSFNKLISADGSFVVEDGKMTVDFIETKGLVIRDMLGNIILGAGNPLDWSSGIGGAGKPADGATRNVATGLWAVDTVYAVGDGVVDGGYGWECIVAHTSSAIVTSPTYPTGSNTYWVLSIVGGADGIDGIDGADGASGQGQVVGIAFIRGVSATAPAGGSFASPTPTSSPTWSDGIPANDALPLWQTVRLFTSDGAAPQHATWSTPAKVGTPSIGVRTVFSIDGATLWHTTPAVEDEYMATQTSTDSGTSWGAVTGAVKITGEAGLDGQGQVKGISFIRLNATPTVPTGGSFSSPNATSSTTQDGASVTWSDGIPADNNKPLWQSTRIFTSDGSAPHQAVWTAPQKVGTPSIGVRSVFSVLGTLTTIGVTDSSWHVTPAVADIFMGVQTSTDNGATWNAVTGKVRIKGETGLQGTQGIQGDAGTDGVTYYTWVKYADTPTTGISDFPSGKAYLGLAYNKTTATKSTVYADYAWSLIEGPQGSAGVNGITTYTWIKYATSVAGAGLNDSPTGMTYIGIAVNKTTAVESAVAGDYTWALIKGADGTNGINGTDGAAGTRGSRIIYDVAAGAGSAGYNSLTTYVYSGNAAGSASYSAKATALIAAATAGSTPTTPIKGDTVYFSNGTTFVNTLTHTGAAWAAPGVIVDGNLLVTGSVTANKINSNGLSIYDSSGALILSAGSSIQSQIAAYSAGATVGATFGVNIGGQINSGNISTYIASAAIQSAQIGNLQVKSANIEELTVGTTKITDNAVSNLVSYKTASNVSQAGWAAYAINLGTWQSFEAGTKFLVTAYLNINPPFIGADPTACLVKIYRQQNYTGGGVFNVEIASAMPMWVSPTMITISTTDIPSLAGATASVLYLVSITTPYGGTGGVLLAGSTLATLKFKK